MFENQWVRFGEGRERVGFAAWPARATAPLPAIIVIQEAWGVDGHIEDLAVRFAKAGYVALAPDLFAENGKRPDELSKGRMAALKEFLNQLPPAAWGDSKARDDALARLAEPRRTAATMQRHQKSYEYHVYEGAYHAFFKDTRPSYNAKASRDAFARTLDFFRRVL